VIKILHEHRVEMRGQGLADGDAPTAAELYGAVQPWRSSVNGSAFPPMPFGGRWFQQAWRCGRAA
jgi:hypothetical protein